MSSAFKKRAMCVAIRTERSCLRGHQAPTHVCPLEGVEHGERVQFQMMRATKFMGGNKRGASRSTYRASRGSRGRQTPSLA